MDNSFSEEISKRLSNIESLLLAQKTVLTFDEVAAYTGLSKSYLYKLTSSSSIPHFKPNGKQVYFQKTEVDSWLLRNRIVDSEELERKANTHVALKKG